MNTRNLLRSLSVTGLLLAVPLAGFGCAGSPVAPTAPPSVPASTQSTGTSSLGETSTQPTDPASTTAPSSAETATFTGRDGKTYRVTCRPLDPKGYPTADVFRGDTRIGEIKWAMGGTQLHQLNRGGGTDMVDIMTRFGEAHGSCLRH